MTKSSSRQFRLSLILRTRLGTIEDSNRPRLLLLERTGLLGGQGECRGTVTEGEEKRELEEKGREGDSRSFF